MIRLLELEQPVSSAEDFNREGYTPFETPGGSAYFGEHLHDPAWDAFLESIPEGEFQQSSMWARVKGAEGWQVARVILTNSGVIRGGFQILWKKTRAGRIGYISRGPVMPPGCNPVCVQAVELVQAAARKLRLAAVVVQGPAPDAAQENLLEERGFLPNRFQQIITATWIIPVTGGIAEVEAGMRKSTRNTLRQARRHGVTVREGRAEDLPAFFELMVATCQRQKVSPNPASLDGIRAVWEAFSPVGHVRLTFAMHDGRLVSGVLCLCFGTKIYIWKKGSLAWALPLHPMEVLYHDALLWAHANGYLAVDHCGVRRKTAEMVLRKEPLTAEIRSSRDFYHMGFGGRPELLPVARIWIRNPILRAMYRLCACHGLGARLLRNRHDC